MDALKVTVGQRFDVAAGFDDGLLVVDVGAEKVAFALRVETETINGKNERREQHAGNEFDVFRMKRCHLKR